MPAEVPVLNRLTSQNKAQGGYSSFKVIRSWASENNSVYPEGNRSPDLYSFNPCWKNQQERNSSFNACILLTITSAILLSGTDSQSTVAPPTRIQCCAMLLMVGRSAQAIGHPQTRIAISHRFAVWSVTSPQSGGSNFSISRTNPERLIWGLQPPQYLMPIRPI
jgi:hypothetical protein